MIINSIWWTNFSFLIQGESVLQMTGNCNPYKRGLTGLARGVNKFNYSSLELLGLLSNRTSFAARGCPYKIVVLWATQRTAKLLLSPCCLPA